jgi:hypothetical protein
MRLLRRQLVPGCDRLRRSGGDESGQPARADGSSLCVQPPRGGAAGVACPRRGLGRPGWIALRYHLGVPESATQRRVPARLGRGVRERRGSLAFGLRTVPGAAAEGAGLPDPLAAACWFGLAVLYALFGAHVVVWTPGAALTAAVVTIVMVAGFLALTVESTYFPLVDRGGNPLPHTYRLVLTPGGLSAS